MMEIILVRHGETDWNTQEMFRGRADIDLNTTGRKQAELLAQYLENFNFDIILTSPLKRALKTAQIIAAGHFHTPIESTMGLIDLDFGEWQGVSPEGVKKKYAELYSRWLEEPHRVKMPGGESLDDVRKRALAVVNDVATRYGGTVVLVSHRVVDNIIILGLLGLDNSHFWNIRIDTCAISTFTYEDGHFILTGHNNTSFLKNL